MPELHFVIRATPVPKARPRFTKAGHAYTPKTTASYEALVRTCARRAVEKAGWSIATKPAAITVHAAFYFAPPKSWSKAEKLKCLKDGLRLKSTKPDADNLVKAVLDAMNGVVFADDALIGCVTALKAWSYAKANTIEISISTDI